MGIWESRAPEIQQHLDSGGTQADLARIYGVEYNTVRGEVTRLRQKGLLRPSDVQNHRVPQRDLAVMAPPAKQVKVAFADTKQRKFNVNEFLSHKIREQEMLRDKSVNQKELTINITSDKPFAIAFSADWHLGNAGTDYASFLRHTQTIIETPNLYTATIGDMVDNFIKSKIKSAMLHSLFNPQEQYDVTREIFKMLREKLLFIIGGNHDAWTDGEAGIDMLAMISEMLRDEGDRDDKTVPYLRDGGGININVNDGEVQYRIFAKHQYRFKSAFNSTHTTKRMYELESHFDIGVTAHTHNPAAEHTHRRNGVYGHDTIYLVCGTYKVEDGHAAAFGYGQSSWISVPTVIFYPHEKRMIPFYHFEDGVEMLKALNATCEV